MGELTAYVDGIGVLGPGLPDWPCTARVLAGQTPWTAAATELPMPQCLSGAERRRVSTLVKLTLAAGLEASAAAAVDAGTLASVFTSSGGDGRTCHEICLALAGDRQISPTRFHNSVHNAAAGYWGIATGSREASNALCAHDGSFAAGLLEALCQVAAERRSVLLIAYDAGYPEPLRSVRPIPDAFAVALLLSADKTARSRAQLAVACSNEPAERMGDAALEDLRSAIPAARSLPLLTQLAYGGSARVVLDYLGSVRLAVSVTACR
jgi:Beta-ketoacyl synthase, N-terminal domain